MTEILCPLKYPHICNLSISQGIFPEQLKTANVIPLYKSDYSMSFKNYRHVSELYVLSRSLKGLCTIGLQLSLKYLKL